MGHREFVRQGADLHMQYTISLIDALTGFKKQVSENSCKCTFCDLVFLMHVLCQIRHLDGHEVEISSSQVTKPGQVDIIKNEGMPLIDDVRSQKLPQMLAFHKPTATSHILYICLYNKSGAFEGNNIHLLPTR